jgi:hypothetical protein
MLVNYDGKEIHVGLYAGLAVLVLLDLARKDCPRQGLERTVMFQVALVGTVRLGLDRKECPQQGFARRAN